MEKNVHNVDGFVAFGGKSPKVINLITREIIPIMRTLEHPIDVAMSTDSNVERVERNENGAFIDERVFTAQTPFPFGKYAESLMYLVKLRLIETGRKDVIRTLEDSCFSLCFEYTDYDLSTEETRREIVRLFKVVDKPIEVEHLVFSEEGEEDIDHWGQRELLMGDD